MFGRGSKYNVVATVPRFDPPGPKETHMDPELRAVAIAATRALQRVRGNGDHRGFAPWHRFTLGQQMPLPRVIVGTRSGELVRIMAAKVVQKPLYNWPRGPPAAPRVVGPSPWGEEEEEADDGEEEEEEEAAGVPLADDGELDALADERLRCLKDGIDVWWYLASEAEAAPAERMAHFAAIAAYMPADGRAEW
ncbi:hypothetical protein F5X96DRAFT_671176 [Biscogniauxia mediterranea]|nr:hypothetical protein F5X96DRAFT_671176 [Biscogniauxia mediterranea]